MFIVISIMFLGVGLGFLIKSLNLLSFFRDVVLSKSITFTIYLLLFLLGITVGSNKDIVNNLASLGWQAFVLAFFASIGSAIAALAVYKLFFSKDKGVSNEG